MYINVLVIPSSLLNALAAWPVVDDNCTERERNSEYCCWFTDSCM